MWGRMGVRPQGEPGVYLDLGTYVTVDPVVAKQVFRHGGTTTTKALRTGLVKDFSGFPGFLDVSVKEANGTEVAKSKGNFCPNNACGRTRPPPRTIRRAAPPTEKRLQETNLKNNVALRKVILSGEPGKRTVKVPPHDLINAP